MKRDKIDTGPRIVTKADVTLNYKEMKDYLHNAQLALCDAVPDERITGKNGVGVNLFQQKQVLVHLFDHSLLTPAEIALVLVSAAWDIFTDTVEKEKTK